MPGTLMYGTCNGLKCKYATFPVKGKHVPGTLNYLGYL